MFQVVKYGPGPVDFDDGEWVGVELDTPTGKHNGAVQGKKYFDCKAMHGMFVRPNDAQLYQPFLEQVSGLSVQQRNGYLSVCTGDIWTVHHFELDRRNGTKLTERSAHDAEGVLASYTVLEVVDGMFHTFKLRVAESAALLELAASSAEQCAYWKARLAPSDPALMSTHDFVRKTYFSPAYCAVCESAEKSISQCLLPGIRNQGVHCRKCGIDVHHW